MTVQTPKWHVPVVRRVLVWSGLALASCGGAQGACQLGVPTVSQFGDYDYVSDLRQTVTVPVSCTGAVPPSFALSSQAGSFTSAGLFQGEMRSPAGDRLKYTIPAANQLRAVNGSLTFTLVIPARQWGAPTATYTDALMVTVTF